MVGFLAFLAPYAPIIAKSAVAILAGFLVGSTISGELDQDKNTNPDNTDNNGIYVPVFPPDFPDDTGTTNPELPGEDETGDDDYNYVYVNPNPNPNLTQFPYGFIFLAANVPPEHIEPDDPMDTTIPTSSFVVGGYIYDSPMWLLLGIASLLLPCVVLIRAFFGGKKEEEVPA